MANFRCTQAKGAVDDHLHPRSSQTTNSMPTSKADGLVLDIQPAVSVLPSKGADDTYRNSVS